MVSKRKAFMDQVLSQIVRFAEGVRVEGGVRRLALEFPDQPVVVVVMRKEEYESAGSPDSLKAPHKYSEQMMVEPRCSWCGERKNSYLHSTIKAVDFPGG